MQQNHYNWAYDEGYRDGTRAERERQKADPLVAMAPEMLKALQRLTHPMADDGDLEFAQQVIAKATGEQT